jgi:CO/xanthine dehydrogenase FAD-binding subunit
VPAPAYHAPRSLDALVAAVRGGAPAPRVLAGGTDLLVRERAAVREGPVLDVTRVPELRRVVREGDVLVLGAAVTYAECLVDPAIRTSAPLLARVAERFASPQIRAVATLGGNVANASPAGDGVAALWALEAHVEAVTAAGPVAWPIDRVVTGPGRLGLPAGSVLTGFRVSIRAPREGQAFVKLVNRAWPEHPMAISVASAAVRLRLDEDGRVTLARVVLGAVAPTPVRAVGAERVLVGAVPDRPALRRAAEAAPAAARPISDLRATAGYREAVIPALVVRALERAAAEAVAGGPTA